MELPAMKKLRKFIVWWYRAPVKPEIGPQAVEELIETATKKRAVEYGKAIAKQNDWRFLEVREVLA